MATQRREASADSPQDSADQCDRGRQAEFDRDLEIRVMGAFKPIGEVFAPIRVEDARERPETAAGKGAIRDGLRRTLEDLSALDGVGFGRRKTFGRP